MGTELSNLFASTFRNATDRGVSSDNNADTSGISSNNNSVSSNSNGVSNQTTDNGEHLKNGLRFSFAGIDQNGLDHYNVYNPDGTVTYTDGDTLTSEGLF